MKAYYSRLPSDSRSPAAAARVIRKSANVYTHAISRVRLGAQVGHSCKWANNNKGFSTANQEVPDGHNNRSHTYANAKIIRLA